MAKATTIKEAIKRFEDAQSAAEGKEIVAAEQEKVELLGQVPPIEKMDATLSTLKAHLALSTNNIEKISSLTGMENLRILSLGRNCIKKIENLEGVADTLEQLWISYNQIEKLVGIDKLTNLKVLYLANNKVKDWSEIDRLSTLDKLEDLLLRACPIYDEHAASLPTYRVEVLKRVPALNKLDGVPIDVDERDAANAGG